MTESFFTIGKSARGLYKEKGSKFLSFVHPLTDFEQVNRHLENLRKEYFDAHHYYYAWMLGVDKENFKASDDGEPSHSAGDPILGQIRSKGLTNILVVVVRYFGGVKLGVGGLIHAYKTAAAEALDQAVIVERFIVRRYSIEFDYAETSLAMHVVKEFNLNLIEQEFKTRCRLLVEVRIGKEESMISKIKTLAAQGHSLNFRLDIIPVFPMG